jgi:hypothetical protein
MREIWAIMKIKGTGAALKIGRMRPEMHDEVGDGLVG